MKLLKKLRYKIPLLGRIVKKRDELKQENQLLKSQLSFNNKSEINKDDFKLYF